MSTELAGTWTLVSWLRLTGDQTAYPLGENATGVLIYTHDFSMAVQIVAGSRPDINSTDALGGSIEERAAAYSTCLAYFGTYEIQGNIVNHRITASLYPNWSGEVQSRPLAFEGDVLVLRTPPTQNADGKAVVNEIRWARNTSGAKYKTTA